MTTNLLQSYLLGEASVFQESLPPSSSPNAWIPETVISVRVHADLVKEMTMGTKALTMAMLKSNLDDIQTLVNEGVSLDHWMDWVSSPAVFHKLQECLGHMPWANEDPV